jgi:hypothetical protein
MAMVQLLRKQAAHMKMRVIKVMAQQNPRVNDILENEWGYCNGISTDFFHGYHCMCVNQFTVIRNI